MSAGCALPRVGLEQKIAFLRWPASYPEAPPAVEAIETHMSWAFLTRERVYKLKKPVRYDYLDFSTVKLRRRNCRREVRLNRRLAPGVYLGVVALVARRLRTVTDWVLREPSLAGLPIGYFGASTGAAAALVAAAERPEVVRAVVSRAGGPISPDPLCPWSRRPRSSSSAARTAR
jgi:hypothetical protein